MPTLFAFVRLLGGPVVLAYVLQAIGALLAIVVVVRIWRLPAEFALKAAALVTGTLRPSVAWAAMVSELRTASSGGTSSPLRDSRSTSAR